MENTPPKDEFYSEHDSPSSPQSPPKSRSSSSSKRPRSEYDFKSDDEGEDSKDPKTIDFKRQKFLERNRLAASKCRQKKKEWASHLEEQARYQAQENRLLRATVVQLREECLYLKNFLMSAHTGCNCVGVKNYLMDEAQMNRNVGGMGGPIVPVSNLAPQGYPMMPPQDNRIHSIAQMGHRFDARSISPH
jgi:bZIP transcription factor